MTVETDIRFVDAYSGKEAVVMMDVGGGVPRLYAPDATSPRTFYATMADAVCALGPGLSCPYTGEVLRPVRDGDAVMFVGGWDPRRPVPRQEFLHFASMRAGSSDAPSEETRVESVPEPVPVPRQREIQVSQEAMDTVLEATEKKASRRPRRRRR